MLDKILNQQDSQLSKSEELINKMVYTNKYIPEMAKKLADDIYKTRYEYTDSFEFIFEKDNYSFCCDCRTLNHGKDLVLCCSESFINMNKIDEPGIILELEYETKKLL